MSGGRSKSGGQGAKRGGGGGNRRRPRGKQNRSGNQRSDKKNRSRQPAAERDRPFWDNPGADAEVQRAIEHVRPSFDPTVVVRSLGSPPLGRFADVAEPVYEAVYQQAQRLAVTMAIANGLLVVDDSEASGDTDA